MGNSLLIFGNIIADHDVYDVNNNAQNYNILFH